MDTSSAVQALPRAEVRTSAGLKSVPGMRPGKSISEVWSHCCAAAWMREETALWPRVASPSMRGARVQDARGAGGAGDWFCGSSTAQTEADRVDVLVRIQGRAVTGVEPP